MDDPNKVYYRESVHRQEGGKWIEYFAVLSGTTWIFNGKTSRERNVIEIDTDTDCAYANKTDFRFSFWVQTGSRKYNFKCDSKVQRFKWMYALRLCASREPPHTIPSSQPAGQTTRGRSNTRRTTSAGLGIPSTVGRRSRSCDTDEICGVLVSQQVLPYRILSRIELRGD